MIWLLIGVVPLSLLMGAGVREVVRSGDGLILLKSILITFGIVGLIGGLLGSTIYGLMELGWLPK